MLQHNINIPKFPPDAEALKQVASDTIISPTNPPAAISLSKDAPLQVSANQSP
jgi:hypothetical protein